MSTQTNSRAPRLALLGLLILVALLVGGGMFVLFFMSPSAGVNSGTPGPASSSRPSVTGGPTNPGASNGGEAGPLTAVVGDTVITLTWQPVQGATGYLVRRDSGRDPLNTKPITATQYIDIGLTDGRTYTYTVAPLISGTEGAQLPPVQAIPNSR